MNPLDTVIPGFPVSEGTLISPAPSPGPPTPATLDADTLQEILTRYVDSRDGYRQASDLVPDGGLTRTFENIARRRQEIAGRVAELIHSDGGRPDVSGSAEASVHRWWIRLRDKLTSREDTVIVEECLRGERELSRTLRSAIESGLLTADHQPLIEEAITEVDLAIRSFELIAEEK